MTKDNDKISCVMTCWVVSAIFGVAIGLMLWLVGGFSLLPAAFLAGIVFVLIGLFSSTFICRESTARADLEKVRKGEAGVAAAGAAAAAKLAANTAGTSTSAASTSGGATSGATAGGATSSASHATSAAHASSGDLATSAAPSGGADTAAAAATGATTASSAFQVQPTASLAGQEELAQRKGEWKYEGDADAAKVSAAAKPAAKKATGKSASTKSADTKAASTKAAGTKSASAKKAGSKPKDAAAKPAKSDAAAKPAKAKRAPVAADGKPETLTAARAGGADDLKLISGVGPKLEGTLNELGFWHFDQIAAWRKKEIEWVDSRLKFKGRIERDDWMSQAKILAKGGETEFSKRSKK